MIGNIFETIAKVVGFGASLLALIVTVRSFMQKTPENQDLNNVIILLCSLVVIFAVTMLTQIYLYDKALSKLRDLPAKNQELSAELRHYIRIYSTITESFHNICHSHRYVELQLLDVITKMEAGIECNKDACRRYAHMFEGFIIQTCLTGISLTLSAITKNDCAVCIKIVNGQKLKTLYRDPQSYRKRKKSDYTQKGTPFIYSITENYAFRLIVDKNHKDAFFCCDDLLKHPHYPDNNRNPEWTKLYNATIVVPIRANPTGQKKGKEEYKLLGFLCCDNTHGGFANTEVLDLVSSIGDMMFNLLFLWDRFVGLAIEAGLENEIMLKYKDWIEEKK